ncbi:pathogenesis-related protein 1 [Raphanus sativus]|uniref:Pathogenesis-related protein 1 n=1 Tax=Raphanus sativus TaxID=3726 RepID=A0A9W3CBW8_RAPSA|nr:pathogenesis-related protein 1 [Raphanus sativus]
MNNLSSKLFEAYPTSGYQIYRESYLLWLVVSYSRRQLILTALIGALVLPSKAQDSPQDYVRAHNIARAEVGVAFIQWDNRVAAFAQSYVGRLTSGPCNLIHSGGPYGENLAKSNRDLSGVDAVRLWVNEKANYNYASNTCNGVCGHYMQVVWRTSVRLGCAKARCNNGETVISCNYDPQGNCVNERPY